MDTDNNGVVTRDEQRRNAAQRFARLDTDNNRVVGPREFDRAMSRLRRGGGDMSDFAFSQLDADNNGFITLIEYERSQMTRFERMDRNNDQVVTRYEFAQHMQQTMDRMQNRAPGAY
jgi:Ca2+-binding EF-hand superfamily protein